MARIRTMNRFIRPCARGRGLPAKAVAVAVVVGIGLSLVLAAGCGDGGAVKQYITVANGILASVNAKEGELKAYWGQPLAQQAGLSTTLAEFRKTLADAQGKLDSTDFPEPCRKLDEELDKAVGEGRTLADITTQFADNFASIAPPVKEAADIVSMSQALDQAGDVPSTVAGLAEKARKLQGTLRSITPAPAFNEAFTGFTAFVDGLLVKNLDEAAKKLDESQYETPEPTRDEETGEQTAPTDELQEARERQIEAIDDLLEPIIEAWGQLDGQMSALLDEARQSTGLKAKTAEVEAHIGAAVQQIQELEKKYKIPSPQKPSD